jgi:ketosteroid isomerase-like protein
MNHLQTVQHIYQAFGRGDVPGIMEYLAEDVEWEHDAQDHGIPWITPGRGKQHVLGFFGVVGKELEITQFDVDDLLVGTNRVIAVIRFGATVRATGKSVRDYELHTWTFGPSGKVEKFRHVVDTHQHWLASRP